jgi:ABC-2 type transport system ATP-binding protein
MGVEIQIDRLTKRFGDRAALDEVSFEVSGGEIFGLIGPNGAGKTTLLRILTGYWLPTSGDIRLDGFSVVRTPGDVQERLGYVCEHPNLYPDHRVDTFLRLMGELRGLPRRELDEAIERTVEVFGLGEVIRRRIRVLSKGFQQRVSLAQALLHEPPVLVIDEPTVGLDPRQQIELRRILQSLGGRHTVLLSTHQLREAEVCCNRVGLLDEGRLVQIASGEEIREGGSLDKLFLEATEREKGEA